MPLIKVQTSVAHTDKSEVETLLKNLAAKLSKHLGIPESCVTTTFESGVPIAGTLEPACYIKIKSLGNMKIEQLNEMILDFRQQTIQAVNIDKNSKVYIEIGEAMGARWGW